MEKIIIQKQSNELITGFVSIAGKERNKHEIILTGEVIQHFIKVVNILDYTIQAMERINELTEGWI